MPLCSYCSYYLGRLRRIVFQIMSVIYARGISVLICNNRSNQKKKLNGASGSVTWKVDKVLI